MIVAVAFDGTIVYDEYPKIGKTLPRAEKTLKRLSNQHQLILYTTRTGKELDKAIEWFKDKEIELWGVNENHHQTNKGLGAKVFAHLYIDVASIGMPLSPPLYSDSTPSLNWDEVTNWLELNNII